MAPAGNGSKEDAEPSENGEVLEVTEIIIETQSKTKEKEGEGVAEVEAVIENGVETDEEKDEDEPAGVEVIAKEIVADSQATSTNQSPEETQE